MAARHLYAVIFFAILAVVGWGVAREPALRARPRPDRAYWVWLGDPVDHPRVSLRGEFVLSGDDQARWERGDPAILTATGDNSIRVSLNGEPVLTNDRWEHPSSRDVTAQLVPGRNELLVDAGNEGGPAAVALSLAIGEQLVVVTDGAWSGAPRTPSGEAKPVEKVHVIGAVGAEGLPWTGQVDWESFRDTPVVEPVSLAPQRAKVDPTLQLLPGFKGERVYTVPKEQQGSWVCLAVDDRGRIYASDQGGKGLFRVTPAPIGEAEATTQVEPVPAAISGAQGLCWLDDGLYANLQNRGSSGVWRITDTNGDDQLDAAEHLIPFEGGGEHGPHAIIPAPGGQRLYFVGGNHTPLPSYDTTRGPGNWQEDLLLPRQWDARGHARGRLAPAGWIASCDLDGKNVEVISHGYRNQYDIAWNRAGEIFTFDADMEWDMGSPWYRPTRVCLATSASEFGWRSGTGKWPEYYEDSVPPILNIGPGSPTGVTFGYGARFPARYQDALYILDWTFGTIYAVHLRPDGSTYSATKEEFVSAVPLAVTDAVIGRDGAFYFAVGGRGTQSALYRIYYVGEEPTDPADTAATLTQPQRLRRQLEALHGRVDPLTVEKAWPHLSSRDRAIRYAARIAIECQPVESWRDRALEESEPQARILAAIALARQGAPDDLGAVIASLGRLAFEELSTPQRLATLRAYALALIRLGPLEEAGRGALLARLDPLFPSDERDVNTELARLLTFLQSKTVVPKTLALMQREEEAPLPDWAELLTRNANYGGPIAKMLADMPPQQKIRYAFILRNATEGWTLPLRKQYFEFFRRVAKKPGGASYTGFLEAMRNDALAKLTPNERLSLAEITGQSLVAEPPQGIVDPVGPGRSWTVKEAVSAVEGQLTGRDYHRGWNLYHATLCGVCHGFNGEGGAIGPDLTTVASTFTIEDLMESIIEPHKVISDQYGSEIVTTKDGREIEGRVIHDEAGVRIFEADPTEPPVFVKVTDIVSIDESPISQMPTELIDALNPEELRDLTAFLLSGGNEKSAMFRKESK